MQVNDNLVKTITQQTVKALDINKNILPIQNKPIVQILADSISPDGIRLTTFQCTYQRYILAELDTHRTFSRNSRSSRATPITKNIEQIQTNPWGPISWTTNQPGMVGGQELDKNHQQLAEYVWSNAAKMSAVYAQLLDKLNVHKQITNRLLESFMKVDTVVSATDKAWKHFFKLRCAPNAQPEMQALANAIKQAYDNSVPIPVDYNEFHLPYISADEKESIDIPTLLKISAARCARVSYTCFDGSTNIQKDIDLFDRLVNDGHFSPLEHVATPADKSSYILSNFEGWNQLRKQFSSEYSYD